MHEKDISTLSGECTRLTDRLRDVNQHLTLQALQAKEQAEEAARRYHTEHHLNHALRNKQRQLRSLATELVLTEQRERKRLATELHDYLGQLMVLGRLKIGQARARLQPGNESGSPLIGDIDEIFTRSLAYIRTLMAELSPPVLYELGLPSALKWLAEHTPKPHQLTVTVDLSHEHLSLPDDQALLLYHSTRELLLNVATHAHTSHATVSLSVGPHNNLSIMVKDKGQGFDPTSVEDTANGEHFGLFSIRERMEAMGGCLRVESAPGQGATITLELPLRETIQQTPPPSSLKPDGRPLTSQATSTVHRLALVDDHAMIRQGLKAILEDFPDLSIVGEATNGVEALSMAADAKPDVILMDVNMPKMDGIEATKRITALHPNTMVIGLSVNNSPQVMDAMRKAGAMDFVSKDAAGDQLYAVISKHLARAPGRLESKAA